MCFQDAETPEEADTVEKRHSSSDKAASIIRKQRFWNDPIASCIIANCDTLEGEPRFLCIRKHCNEER